MSVVLVLVVFGAAIWWQARRKKWGAVRTLVFWLVVLAVVWSSPAGTTRRILRVRPNVN